MPSRAVVVHASAQDQRRQQRLARDLQASYRTAQTAVRSAAPQVYCCRAEAEAAAAQRHPGPVAYQRVDVTVAEPPV
jgi:hypothetical protein